MMMVSGKIFAVGDIHGCAGKLRTLLSRLPFDATHFRMSRQSDSAQYQIDNLVDIVCCHNLHILKDILRNFFQIRHI